MGRDTLDDDTCGEEDCHQEPSPQRKFRPLHAGIGMAIGAVLVVAAMGWAPAQLTHGLQGGVVAEYTVNGVEIDGFDFGVFSEIPTNETQKCGVGKAWCNGCQIGDKVVAFYGDPKGFSGKLPALRKGTIRDITSRLVLKDTTFSVSRRLGFFDSIAAAFDKYEEVEWGRYFFIDWEEATGEQGTDSDNQIPGDLVYSVEGAEDRICSVPTNVCREGDWTWSQVGDSEGNAAHKFYPSRLVKMPQECRSHILPYEGWVPPRNHRPNTVAMTAEECRRCQAGTWEGSEQRLPVTQDTMYLPVDQRPTTFVSAKGKFCGKCECGGDFSAKFTDEKNVEVASGSSAPSQWLNDHFKWVSTETRGQDGKWINCDANHGAGKLSPAQDYAQWTEDGGKYNSISE